MWHDLLVGPVALVCWSLVVAGGLGAIFGALSSIEYVIQARHSRLITKRKVVDIAEGRRRAQLQALVAEREGSR